MTHALLKGWRWLVVFCLLLITPQVRAEAPDLKSVPADLQTPVMEAGEPAPGKRVRQTTPGWEKTDVYHTLYLPMNWQPGKRYSILVEYAGNGGYTNKYGDVSRGIVEGSNLGYGISAGKDYLWLCLPYVATNAARPYNAPLWWGSPEETIRYCTNTVAEVVKHFGGDIHAVIFCGFSRGSIGANYIGLYNDDIAPLWRAFIAYSNYDGVRTHWPYPGADRASALVRLKRLKGRPQFISAEMQTDDISAYLKETGVSGDFTFVPIPFHNHSDQWALRDIPERRQVREWLQQVLEKK